MVRRANAVANQEKVLEAAKKLFAEKGLNAEIKEIAEEAGVGVGTLYRSYADRHALLTALTHESISEFSALVDSCLRFPDAKLALYSLVRQGLGHSERYGWLITAALGWQLPAEALQALAESNPTAKIQLLVDRTVQEGVVREDAPMKTICLQILGHFLLWSYRAAQESADIDTAASEIVDLLLRGAGLGRPESATTSVPGGGFKEDSRTGSVDRLPSA